MIDFYPFYLIYFAIFLQLIGLIMVAVIDPYINARQRLIVLANCLLIFVLVVQNYLDYFFGLDDSKIMQRINEVNIIKHAGFPQVVLRTILLNIDNSHKTMIKADNFYDYAARFVTLRLLTFLSYSLAFFLACDIIDGKKYPNLG